VGGKVVAKPKSFLLKMRLVGPDGMPFVDRRFRIIWGRKAYPPQNLPPDVTDQDGAISVLLDGVAETGEVVFYESVNGVERAVWSVPLQVAADPPIAALPAIAPMPPPPPSSASPQQVADYEKQLVRYRALVLVELRERLHEMLVEWNQVRDVVTTLPLPPAPSASDHELWAAWVLLSTAQAVLCAGFECSWRLWNLGLLPKDKEPSFPFFGSDVPGLLRAVGRFTRKRGDTGMPIFDGMPDALPEIVKVHDKRGAVAP
jgi:hypothetical protein